MELVKSKKKLEPVDLGDVFGTVAKIAPKDKRFATAVLVTVAATVPRNDAARPYAVGPRLERRLEALQQFGAIHAEATAKVKALVAALGDGWGTTQVVAALEAIGRTPRRRYPR